jgi:hypothetical protein
MLIFTKNNMKRQICTMAKSYLCGHTFNVTEIDKVKGEGSHL